jgi:hypothetical protein
MYIKFNIIKGNFAAFEDKKTLNAFDLFISGSNAKKGIADKERKLVEKDLQAKIYTAVKAKDTTSLNTYYNEFIKVADLKVINNSLTTAFLFSTIIARLPPTDLIV